MKALFKIKFNTMFVLALLYLEYLIFVCMYLGKPSKKNKKCGFFPHLGGGFNFHTFLDIFFKNFVLFYLVFVGWKVIFRVKLKKKFFPQNVFPHFRGGCLGGVEKIHTFYFFFEGFPIVSLF